MKKDRKTSSPPRIHFIGIGGIGISALARWFLAKNWAVSGSDIAESEILQELRKDGVKVKIGHKKTNLPTLPTDKPGGKQAPLSAVMVIYSAAVKPSNPELKEARLRRMGTLSYAEAVGELTREYRTVAIAGSHGKSTTTAFTALALQHGGIDPTVIIGTNLKEFGGGNFRCGKSQWLVLEADEWNRSFLNYSPAVAVVTNIDNEHLDTYKNLADIKKTFLQFLARTKPGGSLVLNRDDRNLWSLRSVIRRHVSRVKYQVFWYSSNSGKDSRLIREVLKIPGAHNVSNALAAYTVATKVLGIKKSTALRAIGKYRGAWRRMELRGYYQLPATRYQLPVYDDYAHHPTEIKATLKAFREKYPHPARTERARSGGSPIVCVYQPHQAKRLQALFKDFVRAFNDADILILLPVYEVPGRDKTTSRYTSQKLTHAIKKKYPRKAVYYLKNPKQLRRFLRRALSSPLSPNGYILNPIIVMMGAGDIVNYTPLLLSNRNLERVTTS